MIQFITDGTNIEETTEQIKLAVTGGVSWVQIRMKDSTEDDITTVVENVRDQCAHEGVTLLVDDHVELALRLGLSGVHVGKDDMVPSEARMLLGPDKIIGATANSIADILRLSEQPIDYIGLGPLRHTFTKRRLAPVLGYEGVAKIFRQMRSASVRIPVVVIGGVRLEDVEPLLQLGAAGVAVSGAIAHSVDIEKAAAEMVIADRDFKQK